MSPQQFQQSASTDPAPPAHASPALAALWFLAAGEWEAAHDIAQDLATPTGSWLHAIVHLLEGDLSNANYWFTRASRPRFPLLPASSAHGLPPEIQAEWDLLATTLLADFSS